MENIWVVIINYNGIDDTVECIESILDCKEKVNILIVDNASIMNEAGILKEKFTDVTVIRSEKNNGFSAGNNIGIRYAISHGAEYILLLNNDTVIDRNFIHELSKNCDKDTVLSSLMYYYDYPEKIAFSGGKINLYTGNCNFITKLNKSKIRECSFITGACMFFHKSVIEKVGYLDEEFFMYCEDTDFCIRLQEKGIKLKIILTSKYWHKIGKSSSGNSAFSNYYVTRNRLICIKKHSEYFKKSAVFFTIITRLARTVQSYVQNKELCRSYIKALIDYKKGVIGKVKNVY